MVKDLLAANRYAQALFDVTRLTHQDEEIGEELETLSAALNSSPKLWKFLLNPQLTAVDKRRLLQKIYQERRHAIYETLLNFLTLLFEKNRFYLIREITAAFKQIADEAKGQGTAEVKSAVPLDPRAEAAIVARLEKIAGYRITVKKEIDPRLVGGVVVKVRNKIIDGSVKNRIETLKHELTKIKSI